MMIFPQKIFTIWKKVAADLYDNCKICIVKILYHGGLYQEVNERYSKITFHMMVLRTSKPNGMLKCYFNYLTNVYKTQLVLSKLLLQICFRHVCCS